MTLAQLVLLVVVPWLTQPTPPEAPGLAGTAWTAVQVAGASVDLPGTAADRRPQLVFGSDGRVSGADGCNRLMGSYTVKANGITFGTLAGTQMACSATAALAERFRGVLKGTSHWSLVGGRLEFYGATGQPLAVFESRAVTAPAGSASLDGTSWRLVKFQGGDDRVLTPDDPSKYTIAFLAGGRVAARVDCNRGRATWKATANQLELGPLGLTRARCPAGSLHDQIVKQWPAVRSFVLRDGHLFLSLMADGGTYEFEPSNPPQP